LVKTAKSLRFYSALRHASLCNYDREIRRVTQLLKIHFSKAAERIQLVGICFSAQGGSDDNRRFHRLLVGNKQTTLLKYEDRYITT